MPEIRSIISWKSTASSPPNAIEGLRISWRPKQSRQTREADERDCPPLPGHEDRTSMALAAYTGDGLLRQDQIGSKPCRSGLFSMHILL